MTERPTPRPSDDPAQLSFGMLEGASFLTMESYGSDDAIVLTTVREPPVCGEWSYDDSELEDPRFVADRIDGEDRPTSVAVPVEPIRVAIDAAAPRPAPELPAEAIAPTVTPPVTPESLRRNHEAAPSDTAAALAWASHLERRGDARDALAVLDAAEAAGAERALILCAKASVLGALQRYSDAERLLREAAGLRAPAAEHAIQAGVLACRRARWRDALTPLRAGTAADPSSVTGRYFLGEALNQTDDLRGALEAYETALAIDPFHWRALKGMGKVLDRLGRSTEAAAYHRRAREAQAR
ncbi:MAG: tetratricopeptide repeat protein [Gemmatimonadota bacterium]